VLLQRIRPVRLSLMKFCVFALLAALSWAQSSELPSQNPASTNQSGAVLTKLFPPAYPPLARQARIAGDVKLIVHIRPDGSITSVELFSGHPILAPAAIENARKAEFECRGCSGETDYSLTYTFGLTENVTPDDLARYGRFEGRPVRAARCWYLWKCGLVRVKTLDPCTSYLPPKITQSPGHVRILAFPVCINTESSSAALR
jgi:TonB family protein